GLLLDPLQLQGYLPNSRRDGSLFPEWPFEFLVRSSRNGINSKQARRPTLADKAMWAMSIVGAGRFCLRFNFLPSTRPQNAVQSVTALSVMLTITSIRNRRSFRPT